MNFDIFTLLVGFSFVSSFTPGPNNIMLVASGTNFGFKKTIPHMLGIVGGFAILLTAIGLGLGQLLVIYPLALTILKYAGASYMVYLAYKIATSGPMETAKEGRRPMTFLEAALFQWVNPKAWIMSLTSMSLYTNHENYLLSVFIVVVTFSIVTLPCVIFWAGFGTSMREFLSEPGRLRIFNIIMALLLLACLWPMLKDNI